MTYGIMIDNELVLAEHEMVFDGVIYKPVTPDVLIAHGYKEVVYTQPTGDLEPDEHWTYGWDEGDQIVQIWLREADDTETKIATRKQALADTDYKAIKYAEGWYTEEEYAPIKAERETIREEIRALEGNA